MVNWSLSTVLRITAALLVIVGGFGMALWEYQNAKACQEQHDGEDVTVDCEDFLYTVMVYGGTIVGMAGVAALYWFERDRMALFSRTG